MLGMMNSLQAENINDETATPCGGEYFYYRQICDGEKFPFNGEQLFLSGSYYAPLKNKDGCDSNVTLQLSFMPTSTREIIKPFCLGDTLLMGGQTITEPGTYYIQYTASWGCDSTLIMHLSPQTSSFHELNKDICGGDSFYFNAMWLKSSGTYSAKFMQSNGCDSTVRLNLKVNNLNPQVTVDGSLMKTYTVAESYQWFSCPTFTAIPGATSPEFAASVIGDYALRVAYKGCVDTSVCIFYSPHTTGFSERQPALSFQLYPNPAIASTNLEFNQSTTGSLRIISLSGAILYELNFTKMHLLKINTSEFQAGLYLIQIKTELGTINRKLSIG